ncbi:hypothetical protein [Streptomyces chilikensis]|uniref:Uncharacterized protein n=1 Tax=Streptomyces chilikensis TaxID=1194079 RepID=A0ABV3EJ07_9ACTN
MTGTQDPSPGDADDVERHPCPRCDVQSGSPRRSRGGAVAGAYLVALVRSGAVFENVVLIEPEEAVAA